MSINERITEVPANPTNPQMLRTITSDETFKINSAKLYLAVTTFSIHDNIKFLENLKQGFKKTIFWDKYSLK